MVSAIEIQVSRDRLQAYIHVKDESEEWGRDEVESLLEERSICYGVKKDVLEEIGTTSFPFPLCVAEGRPAIGGQDGYVTFDIDFSMITEAEEKRDFREVMKIPSVSENEKIGTIHPPTSGEKGRDIFGEEIEPLAGKPSRLRPGKHVNYDMNTGDLYSAIDGQISYDEVKVSVHPLYEVTGDLDMKTGNLDFIGSIVVHGNVPTGYTLKSGADITVKGLVEGARLQAEGSIYIEGGVAGIGKCELNAAVDVKATYINQGYIEAGQDIIADRSIVHSECVAKRSVICSNGGIIGGSISSGFSVHAKEVGNRMNTPTHVYMGINRKVKEKMEDYEAKIKELDEEKGKVEAIGEKILNLYRQKGVLTEKQKKLLHKQSNSKKYITLDIVALKEQLDLLNESLGNTENASILIDGTLYSQVLIGFGRYEKQVRAEQKNVRVILEKGEIKILPQV